MFLYTRIVMNKNADKYTLLQLPFGEQYDTNSVINSYQQNN